VASFKINPGLKDAADRLISGDLEGARLALAHFPEFYSRQLLDQEGRLTPFALQDMLGYPLDRRILRCLTTALAGNHTAGGDLSEFASTLSVLQLVDNRGKLTEFGTIRAIESLSLKEQCRYLSLPFDRVSVQRRSKRVEDDALAYFGGAGATGVACEGRPIFLLVQAICADVLAELGKAGLTNGGGMSAYLEALVVEQGRSDRVATEARERIVARIGVESFGELGTRLRQLQRENTQFRDCAGLTVEFLAELYSALPRDQLTRLTGFFLEKPYAHRKGWPDLILVNQGHVQLVEVKEKDKLHTSQIRSLPRIHSIVPATSVVQFERV
jgi:hypothetical protein